MFETSTGPVLSHEEMEIMLDAVDLYGVLEYGDLNGLQLIIYESEENVAEIGLKALEFLQKKCPEFKWAATSREFLKKSHIIVESYFDNSCWFGKEL